MNDEGWPGNAATKALEKLQELEKKELLENENSDTHGEESLHADAARLSTDFIRSDQNSVTENASEFAIDADTEMIRIEAEKIKIRSRDNRFLLDERSDVGDNGDSCQGNTSIQSDHVELGTGTYKEEECLPTRQREAPDPKEQVE